MKNNFFRVCITVMVLMLFWGVSTTKICAANENGFVYEIKNGEATITRFRGEQKGDLVIPETLGGCPVTKIGDGAFLGCSGFTGDLIIPNGVTTIGKSAFQSCYGFTGNLKLPESVTTIGEKAFLECSGFTGDLIIPNGVTTIEKNAFVNCGFNGKLILSDSLITIEISVFSHCKNLTGDLVIPNSVTTIGIGAFDYCGFNGTLTIGKNVTTVGRQAFYMCSGFTGNLIIPESITTIGDYAFAGCSNFSGVLSLHNKLTTIGEAAFLKLGCKGDLIIPDSVTTVGSGAFEWCTNFTSISVPFPNQACMDAEPGWSSSIFYACSAKIIFAGEYVVSFDKNNAAVSGNMNTIKTQNHILTLPECGFAVPDEYRFAGWSRNASGTGITEKTITIDGNSKNVTIYALWKKNTRPLIEKFTERMYTKALDRSAEPEGLKYWADRLEQQVDDGANVAYGFITSTEFIARNLSDDEFLEVMYRTFFDRASDTVGKTYWMDKLNSGASREMVLAGFVVSEEFGNLCSEAEIERGLILEDGKPVNAGIYQFVKRQYTCCLQRDGERAGMDYWATKIAKREVSAVDTAKEFFFSAEFEGKGLNDKQFVERLYETFLGRPFDEVGYAYWNDKMSKGETRREVIDEFAASEEFKGILRGFGL